MAVIVLMASTWAGRHDRGMSQLLSADADTQYIDAPSARFAYRRFGVDGYALGYHILPCAEGSPIESFVGVRYLDCCRREDGERRFASREVVVDLDRSRIVEYLGAGGGDPAADLSYRVLAGESFRRCSSGYGESARLGMPTD